MALVRLIKVHALAQPTPSLLVEHKNLKEFLWIEEKCTVVLNNTDANSFKQSSTKLCDAYGCLGAIHLSRGVESLGYFLVLVTGCKRVGLVLESDIYRITDVSFASIKNGVIESSSAASEMKRLLCSGSFYFLPSSVDSSKNAAFITNSLQSSLNEEREEYLWNRNLIAYFSIQGIPCRTWLTSVMCGGVDIRTFYVGSQQGRVAVINRLNCERVGTRYNVRGVDPMGNVANFVESEQIISIGDNYSSFIMTRGSVPLFWEQPGLNVGSHKVKTPYNFQISFHAFEKHMEKLLANYSHCTLVNLLGSKEGESFLSQSYQNQHHASKYSKGSNDSQTQGISLISFDYHAECRAGKSSNITKLMDQLNPMLEQYGVNFASDQSGIQTGVLRVNCLDCLDRTNSVQTYVGLQMAAKQLAILGHSDNQQLLTRVTEPLKAIWQFTGDLISRMYAGTGALEGKDAVGKLKDGAKSISRSIQNNFLDQGKQETMNSLLRIPFHKPELRDLSQTMLSQQQYRQSSSILLRNMFKRKEEFSEDFTMRIFMGTWNVNGGKFFRSIAYKDMTLKDWLAPDEDEAPAKAYYQAIYEYNSAEDGDLSFAINDFIIVDHELEDGEWLHGSKGDQEGIFPAAYAQRLLNPYVVVYDFPAQEEGDLHLWTDEVVDVIGEQDDWFTGKVYRNGASEEGAFPANYVKKIDTGNEKTPIDMYAIGFEEMVELNAGNIVNASAANQQAWASELHKTLSEEKYVLVTSEQLVGVCLFLFVRTPLVPAIREISVSTIKTGMGGATGNKGAVAISISLYSTSFCFVCSHFAAGQTQVFERNNDFDEIYNKLTFYKGRPLANHDYIFWCGDFNYRIDLSGDEVKDLVKAKSWDKLRENDQLLVQKKMKNVFKGFNEGIINFAPTYKYDLFSDDYDTSEKCRVPAWTDRVLWKRKNWLAEDEEEDFAIVNCGTLFLYNRAEIKTSDHRPVVAMIDIPVTFTRDDDRERVFQELVDELQPIYSPVYVYIEGKPCDSSLFDRFIDSLDIGNIYVRKGFPSSYLVIYVEAWMANKALEHDGDFFEGKRIRLSKHDDNVVDESVQAPPAMVKPPSKKSSPVEPEMKANTSRPNHFPGSFSSGNIAGLQQASLKRPSSVPQLSNLVSQDPSPVTDSSKSSKKPPPRPPAISNGPPGPPPPRPPAINNNIKPGAPKTTSPVVENGLLKRQPSLDLNKIEADALSSQPSTPNYEFPDLSNWRVTTEPPKIKPRKTVPKRRAPVPPKKPPQPPQSILPVSTSALDDTFGSAPLLPAPLSIPLIPAQPYVESNKPDLSLLSSFDPLASPGKPPRPARTAPPAPTARTGKTPESSDPFGDLFSSNNNLQDPWSSGGTTSVGNMNKSFTTDFSDFNT